MLPPYVIYNALTKEQRYFTPFPCLVGTGPNDILPLFPLARPFPQVNVHSHRKRAEAPASRSSARTPPPPSCREKFRGEEHLGNSLPPAGFQGNRRISCCTDVLSRSDVYMNADNGLTPPSGCRPVPTAGGGVRGGVATMNGRGSGGTGSFRASGAESYEAAAAAAAAVSFAETGFEGGGKIPYRESRFSPRRGRRKRGCEGKGIEGDGCDDDVVKEASSAHESPRCDRLFELGDRLQRRVLRFFAGWR